MSQRSRRGVRTAGVGFAFLAAAGAASYATEPMHASNPNCLTVEGEPMPESAIPGMEIPAATGRMHNLAAYMLGMVGAKCQAPGPQESVSVEAQPDGTAIFKYVSSVGRAAIGSDAKNTSKYTFAVNVDSEGRHVVSPADIRGVEIRAEVLDDTGESRAIEVFRLDGRASSSTWLISGEAQGKGDGLITDVVGLTGIELDEPEVDSLVGQAHKVIRSGVGHQPLGLILPEQPGPIFR